MGSNGTWAERDGSVSRWPGEGFGEMSRMRALKSERWTLVEREGRGGQHYSWCGQEHGKKGQGGKRVKSYLAGV